MPTCRTLDSLPPFPPQVVSHAIRLDVAALLAAPLAAALTPDAKSAWLGPAIIASPVVATHQLH